MREREKKKHVENRVLVYNVRSLSTKDKVLQAADRQNDQ